jgi:hypothetical protein
VQGEALTGTNLDGTNVANNPLFVLPIIFAYAPTISGDYSLNMFSPAIDKGDSVAYKTARGGILNFIGEQDLAGNGRLSGDNIDMGAYEVPVGSLQAYNDYATTVAGVPVVVPVLENDSIPASCSNPLLSFEAPSPAHGTPSFINDSIGYLPDAGFTGLDSIVYKVTCGGNSSTATVYITVSEYPDNIDTADCFILPPATAWGIRADSNGATGANLYSPYQQPLVGDMNNDGIPEIIVATGLTNWSATQLAYDRQATTIAMFKGDSIGLAPKLITTVKPYIWSSQNRYVIFKTKINNRDTALIAVVEMDSVLRAYNYDGVNVWSSTQQRMPGQGGNGATPSVADLNHDGIPEIIVAGHVYNSVTGAWICSVPGTVTRYVQAVDVFNTGNLNYIQDNRIYDVVVDGSNQITGLALHKTLTPPVFAATDPDNTLGVAFTASGNMRTNFVDMDNDGKLDAIFQGNGSVSGQYYNIVYIIDPYTDTLKARTVFKYDPLATTSTSSFQFIGDMDGNGLPEIAFIRGAYDAAIPVNYYDLKIVAMKYNPAAAFASRLSVFWTLDHHDYSIATGITMFDFNQDGKQEIVYRDEQVLRIIDGSTSIPQVLATIANISGTAGEYPVVADVDGDGHAEIAIVGGLAGETSSSWKGRLYVYKSLGTYNNWAPARKVWNQYFYHPTQVNNDLTIPKYPMNPTTAFPGIDGVLGTSDDVRPYNNFLQQQTELSKNGTPLWLTPNGQMVGAPEYSYDAVADSLTITLKVHNAGDAPFQNPFKVTVYKNAVNDAKRLTYDYQSLIAAGDTATITFSIPNFKADWMPFSNLAIRINDNGNGYVDQPVCDSTMRDFGSGAVLASDDHSLTSDSLTIINVLANDLSGVCPIGALDAFDTIANSGLHHGTLSIQGDSTFTYKTTNAFIGIDSVDYYIKCGADSSAARVYILKQRPLAQQYIACQDAILTMGFTAIADVDYYWYDAATGGTLVKATASDTLRRVKGATDDVGTWWVEPRYKGIVFPRYRVDLLEGDCEVTNPIGCATDGTVIWSENFDQYDDGNNPASPAYSVVGLAPGMTTYTFGTAPSGLYGSGTYGLVKDAYDVNIPTSYLSHFRDDHTTAGDSTIGRFFIANGRTTPDRVYTQEINNLCSDLELYFSFWMAGNHAEMEWTIYETSSDKVLAKFNQKKLPAGANYTWKQYGFKFPVPAGVTSIRFEIYNYCDAASGNDYVIDDIEVRFCTPPVTLNVVADTTICIGEEFKLTGTYHDDGTFGGSLTYRWEYRAIDSTTWKPLATGTSGNPLTTNRILNPVTQADAGYYRLLVSTPTNIDNVNCRASSDSILVTVSSSPLPTVVSDTTVCTDLIDLRVYVSNIAANNVIGYYADASGLIPLALPLVRVTSDTVYYVRSIDTLFGCRSAMQAIRLTLGVNPIVNPTTGLGVVCVGSSVVISNSTAAGGVWTLSNTNAEITTATPNSVTVKGLVIGKLYVSYTVGSICQTRVTFPLKVIGAGAPTIIIGIER